MAIHPNQRALPLTGGSSRTVRLSSRPPRNLGAAAPTGRQQSFQAMLNGALPTLRTPASAGAAQAASRNGVQTPNGYGPLIADAARRHGVDPALVAGVIESESGFNARATSSAGAKGLMQLMDGTARGLGVTDPYDPAQNVNGGTRFLRQLLDRYNGDPKLALAAYNAGGGAVDRYGGIPPYPETQRYVPKVLAAADRYRGASSIRDKS
jgi:soluble lytic murein transglycosylase-like protein